MATVIVDAAAWRALTAAQQAAVRGAHVVPETGRLADPVVLVDPVVDAGGDGAPVVLAGEWVAFDDPLLGPEHADVVAAALELWVP